MIFNFVAPGLLFFWGGVQLCAMNGSLQTQRLLSQLL